MSRVIVCFGPNGSGKTSFAGSGNGKKWFAELDAGSFRRAAYRNPEDFDVHKYYAPLTNILSQGVVTVSEKGGTAPSTVQRLSGWKEKFWEFAKDYLTALDQGDYEDYIIDTSTKLWLLTYQGFEQEVQEAVGNDRATLDKLHFTEPNARMAQLVENALIKEKNLILIAHEKEQYERNQPTGQIVPDGFKEIPNMADCTLRFTIRGNKPVARIYKAGAGGLGLLDLEIDEPTLPKVMELLDAAEAVRKAGLGMPADAGKIVELAKGLK